VSERERWRLNQPHRLRYCALVCQHLSFICPLLASLYSLRPTVCPLLAARCILLSALFSTLY
jgi:hypothetical protein